MTYGFLITLLIIAQAALVPKLWASDLRSVYQIKLRATQEKGDGKRFELSGTVSVHNQSQFTLDHLILAVYPQRYQEKLPYLNDLNYERIYMEGYKPGGLVFSELSFKGQKLELASVVSEKGKQINTLQKVTLKEVLAPGEIATYEYRATLDLPPKLGPIGTFKNDAYALAHWYPFVVSFRDGQFDWRAQPPQADWEIEADTDQDIMLGDRLFSREAKIKKTSFFQQRAISMRMAPDLHQLPFGKQKSLNVFTSQELPKYVHSALQDMTSDLEAFTQVHFKSRGSMRGRVNFIEAPNREFLVMPGDGVSFISDRTFRLMAFLHKYHEIPLAQAYLYQLLAPLVDAKEKDLDVFWIKEMLAAYYTDLYWEAQDFSHRDARNIGALKLLAWMPSVDLLLHSPQFAFVDTFYNQVYPSDPNRDHPFRYGNQFNAGRTVVERMQDWMGQEKTREFLVLYLRSEQSFRDLSRAFLAQHFPTLDFENTFEAWTQRPTVVNYRLKRAKLNQKQPDGKFKHRFEVQKRDFDEDRPLEPVQIALYDKQGVAKTLRWFDDKESKSFELISDQKVKRVRVDPRRRVREFRIDDNDFPAIKKFVLTQFVTDYDFVENEPLIFLSAQYRRRYGGPNRYTFGFSYFGETYGVSMGYSRLFGRALDGLRLSHGAGISFGYTRLTPDSTFVSDGNVGGFVETGASGDVTRIGISYFYGNQVSFTNPLDGGGGFFSLDLGQAWMGGDHDFYRLSFGSSWVVPIYKPNHLWAFRVFGVTTGPDDIPTQLQPRLGGANAMRGLAFNNSRFQGRHLALLSTEYRHMLLKDIDWNLSLVRIRKVQGAWFVDAGHVVNTVDEAARGRAFGVSSQADVSDLLNFADYQLDTGYGIRFHVDYFGVNPSLLRFDLAKNLRDPSEGLYFYFGVTQSF